jgi:hypothetical protein
MLLHQKNATGLEAILKLRRIATAVSALFYRYRNAWLQLQTSEGEYVYKQPK